MTGTTIKIRIEACSPEDLPVPTTSLRWFVTDERWHFPIVEIEGERADVVDFVRNHWGDETITGGVDMFDVHEDAVDEFLSSHAVTPA